MSLATLKPKVEQLIEYADFKNIIQEALYKTEGSGTYFRMAIFRNTSVKDISMFDFSKVKNINGAFYVCKQLEGIDIDCSNVSDTFLGSLCYGCTNLKQITLRNLNITPTSVDGLFSACTSLESINWDLDFSKITTRFNSYLYTAPFYQCYSLKEMRVVAECIKISISFVHSPLLTAESIQSIIDGLATVETAQTLTLHADVKAKLTQAQLDTITGKNWSLA